MSQGGAWRRTATRRNSGWRGGPEIGDLDDQFPADGGGKGGEGFGNDDGRRAARQ